MPSQERWNTVYRSGSTPKCPAKKARIREIFHIVKTTTVDKTRKKYPSTILSSIPKSNFKTVLKDYTFEAKMTSTTASTDDVFLFLCIIRQIMDEITNEAQNDMSVHSPMYNGRGWASC